MAKKTMSNQEPDTEDTAVAVLEASEPSESEDTETEQETPEPPSLSTLEHEHYLQIQEAEQQAFEAEEEFEDANAVAKMLKKRWESRVEVLRQLIRRGPDSQLPLPFAEESEQEPDDAWKQVPIVDVLQLTDKQAEKLLDAGIKTVGDFELLRAGEGITSLKGIGRATADAWEENMLDWLAQNSRPTEDDDLEDDDVKE
jgi:hypothetical protein